MLLLTLLSTESEGNTGQTERFQKAKAPRITRGFKILDDVWRWPIQAVFRLEWGSFRVGSIPFRVVCRNPLAALIPVYHANSAIEFILQHLAPKPLRGRRPSVSVLKDFFRRILFLIDRNSMMVVSLS